MVLLPLKDRHQLIPLSIKILQPCFNDSLLLEHYDFFSILFHYLSIMCSPLLKDSIEPLDGLCPLKLPDPYLLLLDSS